MRKVPSIYRPLVAASGRPHATPAPAVIVRAIDIACSLNRALDFMEDIEQWLPWTMPTLQSMQPLPFSQWLLTTPRHLLKLRLRAGRLPGALTYELVDPAAGTWPVPLHLVPTPTGCRLVITLRQPAHVLPKAYATCVRNVSSGLGTLKLVLEQD